MAEAASVNKVTSSKYEKYEIEDAARTLVRAEEIKQDTNLCKLVYKELDRQAKALAAVNQGRKA
jgi:hypothetical protein